MGATDLARLTRAEYTKDPDRFREAAVSLLLPAALEAVYHALKGSGPFTGKAPARWAVRIALQVAGWLDMRQEVAVTLKLAQEFGLSGEAEIREKLELASRVRALDLPAAEARATDLLARIIEADPSARTRIATRLRLSGPADAAHLLELEQGS